MPSRRLAVGADYLDAVADLIDSRIRRVAACCDQVVEHSFDIQSPRCDAGTSGWQKGDIAIAVFGVHVPAITAEAHAGSDLRAGRVLVEIVSPDHDFIIRHTIKSDVVGDVVDADLR